MKKDKTIRLLLVEDNLLLGETLTKYLQEVTGYEVHYATNGSAGLAIAEQVSLSLVVADFKMPGMDGYTLCQELRRLYKLPMILISGFIDDAYLQRIADAGFPAVLRKPFSPDELECLIHTVLDLPLVKLTLD